MADITAADETPSAIGGASRYTKHYLHYPSPTSEPQAFLDWISSHNNSRRYDLILPTTEVTSQLLLQGTDALPIPFAGYNTVMALANKARLVETAQKIGIPVPESQFFANAAALDPRQLTYPCVLKPAQSKIFTGSGWVATTVRLLKDETDLNQALSGDDYLAEHPFMIQAFIPGHGAGVFCLYDKGAAVQFFAHERLREKPPEGGVSVLSQSAPLTPQLVEYSRQLLDQVHWHGVAMVEFRIAPDGQAYLMEVNTRFWGSLQLAIDSGVDFPAQLAKRHLGLPTEPVTDYKVGQRLRWLLGDLDSLYIFLKRPHPLSAKFKRVLQFLTPRFRGQKHEVNRLHDFKPFIEELRQYVRNL
ncbi:ATP-grasp domain-containing protein [Reinekea blandensis]|nr:ATP-grasp domain-containing protein [Reinekea blandensis]